jgi:hypothetical protein
MRVGVQLFHLSFIKILGVLYISGRDHGFKSVVDLKGFSTAVMNAFFLEFVSAFAITMFPIWVVMPSTSAEIERVGPIIYGLRCLQPTSWTASVSFS